MFVEVQGKEILHNSFDAMFLTKCDFLTVNHATSLATEMKGLLRDNAGWLMKFGSPLAPKKDRMGLARFIFEVW